jgi:hypothetical protein
MKSSHIAKSSWKTAKLVHEGFPLFLRYLEDLNIDDLRARFQTLAVITHHLSQVTSNGLPDADYNDGLHQFDLDVQGVFESTGVTCLIETFAGKRIYYVYVEEGTDVEKALEKVVRSYPKEKLSTTIRPDPGWSFVSNYRKQYLR